MTHFGLTAAAQERCASRGVGRLPRYGQKAAQTARLRRTGPVWRQPPGGRRRNAFIWFRRNEL